MNPFHTLPASLAGYVSGALLLIVVFLILLWIYFSEVNEKS